MVTDRFVITNADADAARDVRLYKLLIASPPVFTKIYGYDRYGVSRVATTGGLMADLAFISITLAFLFIAIAFARIAPKL